jgi:hypothetical protein
MFDPGRECSSAGGESLTLKFLLLSFIAALKLRLDACVQAWTSLLHIIVNSTFGFCSEVLQAF